MIKPLSSWDSEATWATFETGDFRSWTRDNVEVQKHWSDLERYAQIVEMSQPDLIIETGTRSGGSACWFHQELDLQVISIDIAPQFNPTVDPPIRSPHIKWIRGSSISDRVIREVYELAKGKRVMVSLDSDHVSPHVQAEIAVLGLLVSPGCYLVVEDGCFDMWPAQKAARGGTGIPTHGGPLHAIRTQLDDPLGQSSGMFWRDEATEGISSISHSPCGWWRRHE